jgi:hypothetical protein
MLILNVAKRGSMSRATWYDVPVGFLLQYFFQVLQFFNLMATVRPIFLPTFGRPGGGSFVLKLAYKHLPCAYVLLCSQFKKSL